MKHYFVNFTLLLTLVLFNSCKNESPQFSVLICDKDPLDSMEIWNGNKGKNSNRFGCVRTHAIKKCDHPKKNKPHNGLDLEANPNTKVYSIVDGVVWGTGTSETLGLNIVIKKDDLFYCYAHLKEILVKEGRVSKKQLIAKSGDSGNAKGNPHLHLEVRKRLNQESYNKMQKLNPEDGYIGTKFDKNGNTIDDGC